MRKTAGGERTPFDKDMNADVMARSEATKQSMVRLTVDCFVASLLAMTERKLHWSCAQKSTGLEAVIANAAAALRAW
jgi:hypothetical protein